MDSPLLEALGQVIPLAVGAALSPLPVIAVVLVAMSPRAASSGPALVAGRMLGLAMIVTLTISAADLLYTLAATAGLPALLRLVLGLALLVLGVTKWRPKPKGAEPALPGWMASFDSIAPGRAFGIGILLSLANPKELALLAAVGLTVGGAPIAIADEVVLGLVVVAVASITVALPVIAIMVAPRRMTPVLERVRGWLTANSSVVMGVLLIVIGATVAGGAISEL